MVRAAAVKDVTREADKATSAALQAVSQPLEAALNNELLTRGRVDRIEGLLRRGFWGRALWLFLGR